MAASDFVSTVVDAGKQAIQTIVDFIIKLLTPVINAARKIPGVDKLLASVAVNGPRYGTVAAAFIAKFVSDQWAFDLGKVTIPVVNWEVSFTNILSILIAFAIGYAVQKVLTLPRAAVPYQSGPHVIGDPMLAPPDDPELADFFAGTLGSGEHATVPVPDGGKDAYK